MKSAYNKFFKWILITLIIAFITGSISALFLWGLDFVTQQRNNHTLYIYLLPLGGLIIGLMYYFGAKNVEGGNNLLIQEMHKPKKNIHWKIIPLVFFGTLLTHLFGGSAGREGTAVQMGGAVGDSITRIFKWTKNNRNRLLRMGVAAGFSSIFGTPLAGAVFAFELAKDRKINWKNMFWTLLASFGGHFICLAWGISHLQYSLNSFPDVTLKTLLYTVLAGLAFGISAYLFNQCKHFFTHLFSYLKTPYLRPVLGGVIILALYLFFDINQYLGLGIPVIQSAFETSLNSETFFIKLLLTALTLGAGFKGGEATPLFFIGATLGNLLFFALPLPMDLLAGMGFIAVFGAATNTPIASTIIGLEMFGFNGIMFFAISTYMAYLVSGKTSVYSYQQVLLNKYSIHPKK
jgi:H+/Cl- antiporter ClcA